MRKTNARTSAFDDLFRVQRFVWYIVERQRDGQWISVRRFAMRENADKFVAKHSDLPLRVTRRVQ